MDTKLYCVVDADGQVYGKPDAASCSDVVRACGLNERDCQAFDFDFDTRRIGVVRGTLNGAIVAQRYFNDTVGTPDRLMAFAAGGWLPKSALVALLLQPSRRDYLERCERIERSLTEACAATADACLASGCSCVEQGEICLEPLLADPVGYQKACAAEWIELFRRPENRITVWQN